MIRFCFKSFFLSIFLLVVLIYIALNVKDQFVRPFLGDVLVVIWLFYTLKAFLNTSTPRLAFSVLVIAYLVEFSQYIKIIHWFGLEDVKLVRIVLGATFDINDLGAYTIGWLLILAGYKLAGNSEGNSLQNN